MLIIGAYLWSVISQLGSVACWLSIMNNLTYEKIGRNDHENHLLFMFMFIIKMLRIPKYIMNNCMYNSKLIRDLCGIWQLDAVRFLLMRGGRCALWHQDLKEDTTPWTHQSSPPYILGGKRTNWRTTYERNGEAMQSRWTLNLCLESFVKAGKRLCGPDIGRELI